MLKSEQINEVADALTKFQAECQTVGFDSTNPFLKNKYASLNAILKEVSPRLSKLGLSICQTMTIDGGVSTILLHKSGQYIGGELKLTPSKNDPQGIGSAITYARRYSLSAILGISSGEDDDANTAVSKKGFGKVNTDVPTEIIGLCNEKEILPAKREAIWKKCLDNNDGDVKKAKVAMLDELTKM